MTVLGLFPCKVVKLIKNIFCCTKIRIKKKQKRPYAEKVG